MANANEHMNTQPKQFSPFATLQILLLLAVLLKADMEYYALKGVLYHILSLAQ